MEKQIDYTRARPLGSDGEFERIIDSDYLTNHDGSRASEDDMFKLEYSGWKRHIEFAKKAEYQKDAFDDPTWDYD